MKLCTRESVSSEAAELWKEHYNQFGGRWTTYDDTNTWPAHPEKKYLELVSGAQTPERVDEILGRNWSQPPRCSECDKQGSAVVQLGEEPDYDSATVWVCRACLEKAVALVVELEAAP